MKAIITVLRIFILSLLSCTTEPNNPVDEFSCEIQSPVLKGNRMIGLDLLNLTESNTFDQNIALASELGIEFIALHLNWTSIETSPNNFEDPFSALELLSQYAQNNNFKFSLTIRPIDIPGKTVPADLKNTRFSDAEMINRFKSLVDFIFSKVDPSILLNFQIGNEIDGYDTSNEPATFWDDYGIFLREITAYIHLINPSVKVGFTGTLDGLIEQSTLFLSLVQNVDILGVTYYPLNSDFSVREPNSVFTDFDNLVTIFGNTPIYIQEVGYPTSSLNNSSELKQAEFYSNLFKAWDLHSKEIKSVKILRLNDLSLQGAQESAEPYGITCAKFVEYLRTLGIRTYENEGTNKQAFNVIKMNLSERNW